VEEVVALLAGNLKANKTEAFSRDNGLLTFAADNDRSEFHSSPLQLYLLSLVGRLDSQYLQTSGQPRTRRALQPSRSPHARIRWTARATRFLLIVAEEVVVGRIGNENLVTHIPGD
jgi:hypothetical protein